MAHRLKNLDIESGTTSSQEYPDRDKHDDESYGDDEEGVHTKTIPRPATLVGLRRIITQGKALTGDFCELVQNRK